MPPSGRTWRPQFVDQPGIQGLPRGLFFHEGMCADEAVAVFAAAMLKTHHVQHAITIEQVVGAKRLVYRVLRVAQIHPVQAFWDFTNDLQVGGIPFLVVGCERPGHQRMLVWHQGRPGFRNEFSVHRWLYGEWPRAQGCLKFMRPIGSVRASVQHNAADCLDDFAPTFCILLEPIPQFFGCASCQGVAQ